MDDTGLGQAMGEYQREKEVAKLLEQVADLKRREAIIVYYLNHLLPPVWGRDLVRDLESGKTVAEIAGK